MDRQPRTQHYQYAHYWLRSMFFQAPNQFLSTLQSDGVRFLRYYWEHVGSQIEGPVRLSPIGLSSELHWLEDGTTIAIISLPKPERITEAHFVAPVYRPAAPESDEVRRYFTLEYSLGFSEKGGLVDDGKHTVMCEWTADGSHRNYGEGSEPELSAFFSAVLARLGADH